MSALNLAKSALRSAGIDTRALYHTLSARSLKAALREQGLTALCGELREIVPDLSAQYTSAFDAEEYARFWELKMRGMHAFQTRCILDTLDIIGGEGKVIADIGDSAGTHATYVKALARPEQVERIVSVNLDPEAVAKVRAGGGEAVLSRAEELDLEGLDVDLFMSFEMVEHLTDPVRFFHDLATRGSADYLLITVPYRRDSRFGGDLIRLPDAAMPVRITAEQVHIFELSPADWRLMARFGGYEAVFSRIYRQYPMRSPMRITQPLWRKSDLEGFLAVLFKRDTSLADRYTGW